MAQVDLAASVLRPQIVEEMDQGVTLKNEMKDGKMDTYGKLKIVPLTPYAHQVSGHSFIMSFDEYTLCKPLHEREHRFYEGLPAQLKAFTPAYKGMIRPAGIVK